MTQIVDKCIKDMCDECHKNLDGPCAWLSLGNEYCDEIMNIQQEIDRLNSIIRIKIDENYELKQRNDKAIEYNQKIYDTSTENERLLAKINLDILRGEDNEPKESN